MGQLLYPIFIIVFNQTIVNNNKLKIMVINFIEKYQSAISYRF